MASVRSSQFCLHFIAVSLWLSLTALAADQSNFFLPQNPIAAAYVLGRLSNQELIAAPRGEFVYVALLQRKGLDRKYRLEALDGLAAIRHTDRLTELMRAIADLDQKGEDGREPLRDLGILLVESGRADLAAKRELIEPLTLQTHLPLTRQIALAAMVVADGSTEPSWAKASTNSEQLTDLVSALALVPDSSLRAQFYPNIKPLLLKTDSPELRRAAITTIVNLPGHDADTFDALAQLARNRVELPTVIASLQRVPRQAWSSDQLKPLAAGLLDYLQQFPTEQRTGDDFTAALRFGTEIASLLPQQDQRNLLPLLRSLGPTLVTLRAVYEQMRFDKALIVIETGRAIVITLQNDDAMPHNLAILAPGALKDIGLAAEKMPPEPDSEGRLYVPPSPKVLHATRLVNPGQKIQLAFDAPAQAGDYPFVCTFPGHWLRMSGTLTVVSNLDSYLASHPIDQQPKLTEWKLADFSADWPQADAGRNWETGRELFSKLACVQCHKLGATGSNYGPDLTDVFKRYHNDRAAVLEQILDPSKIIADRYRNINFDLKNDESLLGMVLKEDDQTVTIQTGPSDLLIQVLKKAEIQRQHAQASSPMPLGLLGSLSKSEIFDLLAFLASGGQPSTAEHQHAASHGQ